MTAAVSLRQSWMSEDNNPMVETTFLSAIFIDSFSWCKSKFITDWSFFLWYKKKVWYIKQTKGFHRPKTVTSWYTIQVLYLTSGTLDNLARAHLRPFEFYQSCWGLHQQHKYKLAVQGMRSSTTRYAFIYTVYNSTSVWTNYTEMRTVVMKCVW